MTAPATSEQIDLERNGERGERENGRKGEAGGVWHFSITIRAVFDSPTSQNKETNSSQSRPGSHRMNPVFFIYFFSRTAQEPVAFTCPLFKESSI